jgi:predicted RNase H-like nuclease (RuvC/YqgF family)
VKTYRAALTENLVERANRDPTQANFLLGFTRHREPFDATTTIQAFETKLDTLLAKKLDVYLAENNTELNKTRENIDDLRGEVRKNVEESKGEIGAVEKKLQMLEVEFQEYSSKINRILENVCLTFANGVDLSGDDKNYYASEAQKLKAPTGAKLTE